MLLLKRLADAERDGDRIYAVIQGVGVAEPNPKARFGDGPLYVNSEARPWVHGTGSHPRRAGVNAFGFGGTKFHAILEEYTGEYLSRESVTERRPSELFLWSAGSRAE